MEWYMFAVHLRVCKAHVNNLVSRLTDHPKYGMICYLQLFRKPVLKPFMLIRLEGLQHWAHKLRLLLQQFKHRSLARTLSAQLNTQVQTIEVAL